jgi:hypothetical protein
MSFIWKVFFSSYVLSHWSMRHFFDQMRKLPKPVHIIFCTVDHYEPGTGNASPKVECERVDLLLREFPRLSDAHLDSSGNRARRTWFFPPHYHRLGNLKKLVSLCEKGYGEIELHLHHGKTRPDTAANLEKTIRQCIADYSRFGIFGMENRSKRFGFIHGDWALNNSSGGRFCGVDDETSVLKRTGCYADFTFPSRGRSNPLRINSIFYARSRPGRPKSHRTGKPVRAAGLQEGGLMMIQGPLFPSFNGGGAASLRIVGDRIGMAPMAIRHVDSWVSAGIHVKGRPNWVFVKTHTHGAVDHEAVLGPNMNSILSYLEAEYNDGRNYLLHYATAREAYNIIRAIEAGEAGDNPEAYRNYAVAPPVYDSSPDCREVSFELKRLVFSTYPGP